MGTFLGIVWYGIGLVGSFIFSEKGYGTSLGGFLWGAMLGPVHLLIALFVPPRR
jgi:hypothetical protein